MNAKLTEDQAAEVKWLMALRAVLTAANIARTYGVTPQTVQRIDRGIKWPEVIPQPPRSTASLRSDCKANRVSFDVPPTVWTNSWMQLTADSDARTLTPSDSQQHSS